MASYKDLIADQLSELARLRELQLQFDRHVNAIGDRFIAAAVHCVDTSSPGDTLFTCRRCCELSSLQMGSFNTAKSTVYFEWECLRARRGLVECYDSGTGFDLTLAELASALYKIDR